MINRLTITLGLNLAGLWGVTHSTVKRNFKWALFIFMQNTGSVIAFIALLQLIIYTSDNSAQLFGTQRIEYIFPGLILIVIASEGFVGQIAFWIHQKLDRSIADYYIAPINANDMFLGLVIAELFCSILYAIPLWLILSLLFDFPLLPANLPIGLFMIFTFSVFATLCGICTGLLAKKWDHFSLAFTFIFLPIGAMSGFFFPLERMPAQIAEPLSYNPIAWYVSNFRAAWFGEPFRYSLFTSTSVILLASVGLYLISSHIYNNRYRLV